MKKSLLLFLLFASCTFSELHALTVSIWDCTRPTHYRFVRNINNHVHCLGSGRLSCDLTSVILECTSGNIYSTQDVTDYVISRVKRGMTDGKDTYKNELPLNWGVDKEGVLNIQIDNCKQKDMKEFDLRSE